MVSLTELFNPTFLMFLGILLLAIALLVLYFESKFREQNHKIASMLSLVSSLAEELNTNKMMINHLTMGGAGHVLSQNISNTQQKKNVEQNPNTSLELIDVSDDDDDDDDDEEEEEDNADDDADSSESEDEKSVDDNLEETHVIQIHEQSNVKVLKIDIDENENENDEIEDMLDNNSDNIDILNDLDELVSCNSESTNDNLEDALEVSAPLYRINDELEKQDISNEVTVSSFDLKSINISTLEGPKDVLDFKKLSLNKLRSIVSEKRLSNDASKLKKPDLLKLLGSE